MTRFDFRIRIIGNERKNDPDAIEDNPGSQDRFPGYRANSGALYKFAETGHWRGVNDDLAEIGQGLDCQDIGVSAPQPASDRAG